MKRRELLKGLILAPLAVKLAPVLKLIPDIGRGRCSSVVVYDEYAFISKQALLLQQFRMDMDRAFLFGETGEQVVVTGIKHLSGMPQITVKRMNYER